MEARSPSILTPEQQAVIDAFHEALKNEDASRIIAAISNLQTLPDEHSPIRAIVFKEKGMQTIAECFALIRQAFTEGTQSYLQKEILKQAEQFATSFNIGLCEKEKQTIERMDLNLLQFASTRLYIHFVLPIYKHVAWVHASQDNQAKLDQCTQEYENLNKQNKSFFEEQKKYYTYVVPFTYESRTGFNTKMRQHNDKTTYISNNLINHFVNKYKNDLKKAMQLTASKDSQPLADAIASGYLSGNHYLKASTLPNISQENQCLVIEKLIDHGKFDEMKKFMFTFNLEQIKKVFSIAFAKKQFEAISTLVNFYFNPDNNNHYICEFPLYIAAVNRVDVIDKHLKHTIKNLKKGEKLFTDNMNNFIEQTKKGYAINNLDLATKRLLFIYDNIIIDLATNKDRHVLPSRLLAKIKALDADEIELKRMLLAECLYKDSILGNEVWTQYSEQKTHSLKRLVPNEILTELYHSDVDIAALPGCENYSLTFFNNPPSENAGRCPKKAELEGKMPPKNIPLRSLKLFPVRNDKEIQQVNEKTSSISDGFFKL